MLAISFDSAIFNNKETLLPQLSVYIPDPTPRKPIQRHRITHA